MLVIYQGQMVFGGLSALQAPDMDATVSKEGVSGYAQQENVCFPIDPKCALHVGHEGNPLVTPLSIC